MIQQHRPTVLAEDIIASVQTIDEARAAIERLADDIDNITVGITNRHERTVDGLMDREDYDEWRKRADAALWHKRKAVLTLERFIRRKEQEAAAVSKTVAAPPRLIPSDEERKVKIQVQLATVETTMAKAEYRRALAAREQRIIEVLDRVVEQNDPALLIDAFFLLVRLAREYDIELADEDRPTMEALSSIVQAYRQQQAAT